MARRRQGRYRRGYINMADSKSVDQLFHELKKDLEAKAASQEQQPEAHIDQPVGDPTEHTETSARS